MSELSISHLLHNECFEHFSKTTLKLYSGFLYMYCISENL